MQFFGTSHVSRSAHTRRLRVEPLEDRRMLAVFSVDNLNDAGLGSLRQAIDDANANLGADTVEFEAGLSGTIALSTGEMTITDELLIDGPGAGDLMIDAQQNSRIFHIAAASGPVTFEGLYLTGGEVTGSGGAILSETLALLSIESSMISGNAATGASGDISARGGGISAFASVTITSSTISGNSVMGDLSTKGGGIYAGTHATVTNSTISGNSATGGEVSFGGGIYANFGDVTVTGSTISGNSVTGDSIAKGGGVAGEGNVTVTDSMISGNSATSSSASSGGGIFTSGDVTVTGSTISGNSATGGSSSGVGGGIDVLGNVAVSSSTISGNSATGRSANGGGILSGFVGAVTITGSTIAGNSVTGISVASGGGIFSFSAPITIENSIVAGNHDDTGIAPDLRPFGGPLTVRYSLIGDNTGTGLAPAPVGMPDADGNLIGTAASPIDPLLGPLQDNGGPTFTHALLVGSPAINAGDPAFAPPPDFDQRGDPFVRVSDGRIDMGAFERQPATLDERIEHLLKTGVLNRGQANSLLVKLNPGGNERAQLNRLRAFINEINALVRAGILSAAEGQKLIDGAEGLRASLSVDAVLPMMVGRR